MANDAKVKMAANNVFISTPLYFAKIDLLDCKQVAKPGPSGDLCGLTKDLNFKCKIFETRRRVRGLRATKTDRER
jgi:hypothetical protein